MSKANKRACIDCGRPTTHGRCPACQAHRPPRSWGQVPGHGSGSNVERGYGADWYKVRASVLKRSPICEYCRRAVATQVDHALPKHLGGTDDESNLLACCADCHAAKTRREARRARVRPAPTIAAYERDPP